MPKVLINGELVEVPDTAVFADDGTTPLTATLAPPAGGGRFFTEEEVAKIREDEKNKVYGRLDAVTQELASFKEQVGSLTAAEQRREAQLKEEQARLEEEARRKETEELDAKTLLQRREQEWQEQLAQQRADWESRFQTVEQERETERALREKERQFNDLRDYAQATVAANEDKIAPQLRAFVGGNSKEEIDASIARAVDATDAIAAEMAETLGQPLQQQVVQQQPAFQQQVPVTAPPVPGTHVTAPVGADPAAQFQTLTREQIAEMPMDQYAQLRSRLGIGGQGQNRGLFG